MNQSRIARRELLFERQHPAVHHGILRNEEASMWPLLNSDHAYARLIVLLVDVLSLKPFIGLRD